MLSNAERARFRAGLLRLSGAAELSDIENRTINQNLFAILDWLPTGFADLLILDPPYNVTKKFNEVSFRGRTISEYADWIESWLPQLIRTLKPSASVYICADWRSSAAVHLVADKYLHVRNRITWEREKGRGARANWKNCAEDIWFCTVSDEYTFNAEAVKLRRRVVAPYRDHEGRPKDWEYSEAGNFRLTHASNLWTDLTVPFWSMPENTEHPTQKPEKLIAKLILASSEATNVVFDPFLGSGTTAVVAAKLDRSYVGIEADTEYCEIAGKRLAAARDQRTIQGYADEVFWERNSLPKVRRRKAAPTIEPHLPFTQSE